MGCRCKGNAETMQRSEIYWNYICKETSEIDYQKYDKIIFAYENSGESKSLSEIIKKEDKNILYIIGPEGGITADEVDFLKNNKAIEISLGKRILRAETAAIVVCGIIANFYI